MSAKKIVEDRYIPEPNSGCWLWVGTTSRKYGSAWYKNKSIRAHRLSYQAFKGEIPKGMFVCHSCDTCMCVNPDHLFLGTHQDNMTDMKRKGRAASGPKNGALLHPETRCRGERVWKAKLQEEEVRIIKAQLREGRQLADIAAEYGVGITTISAIKTGRNWKHV